MSKQVPPEQVRELERRLRDRTGRHRRKSWRKRIPIPGAFRKRAERT